MVVRIDGKKERYDCLTRASPMTTVPPKADQRNVLVRHVTFSTKCDYL